MTAGGMAAPTERRKPYVARQCHLFDRLLMMPMHAAAPTRRMTSGRKLTGE